MLTYFVFVNQTVPFYTNWTRNELFTNSSGASFLTYMMPAPSEADGFIILYIHCEVCMLHCYLFISILLISP